MVLIQNILLIYSLSSIILKCYNNFQCSLKEYCIMSIFNYKFLLCILIWGLRYIIFYNNFNKFGNLNYFPVLAHFLKLLLDFRIIINN